MMSTAVFLVVLATCTIHCSGMTTDIEKDTYNWSPGLSSDANFIANGTMLNSSNHLNIQRRSALDCVDLLRMGHNKSGVYEIWPINRLTERKYLNVYCDMDTNGGGWTVIQRRGDFKTPKDYFFRDWDSYKEGFGDIEQDFWLGNDYIYALTNQKLYSVRFDLKDVNQNERYAIYDKFWIDDENNKYTLHISVYKGDAGDSMTLHNNQVFVTSDKDNKDSCAKYRQSGWWHASCGYSNLNGLYQKGKYSSNSNGFYDGIFWDSWKGSDESLTWTEIKIRPKHFRTTF